MRGLESRLNSWESKLGSESKEITEKIILGKRDGK
jgi:hypothetical protein